MLKHFNLDVFFTLNLSPVTKLLFINALKIHKIVSLSISIVVTLYSAQTGSGYHAIHFI